MTIFVLLCFHNTISHFLCALFLLLMAVSNFHSCCHFIIHNVFIAWNLNNFLCSVWIDAIICHILGQYIFTIYIVWKKTIFETMMDNIFYHNIQTLYHFWYIGLLCVLNYIIFFITLEIISYEQFLHWPLSTSPLHPKFKACSKDNSSTCCLLSLHYPHSCIFLVHPIIPYLFVPLLLNHLS